jgi:hypothetical protein
VLAEVDPPLISDRPTVQWALAQLVMGAPLPAVLDQLQDDDLKGILRVAASSHPGLYSREQAAPALREIVGRRLLARIKGRLAEVEAALATCHPGQDRQRYTELLREKQDLQRQLKRPGTAGPQS